MNWYLKFINILYRAWFFALIGIATIVLFPFLFIFTIKEKYYRNFYKTARVWGSIIIYGMGFWPIIKRLERLEKDKSYMFIANHSSMMDIMLMYRAVQVPFVFVGKKELAKMPLFGFFYKRSSILVDRSDMRSRNAVFKQAERRFAQGNGICIFPEGGVPKNPAILLGNFKDGAFRMAIDDQIPIVPLIFYDNKTKYPYKLKYGSVKPGFLKVKMLRPISTKGLDKREDKSMLRDKIYALMHDELTHPNF